MKFSKDYKEIFLRPRKKRKKTELSGHQNKIKREKKNPKDEELLLTV